MRREMEAEHVDGAAQAPQPPARQSRRAVGDERFVEHGEIGQELGGVGIGRRLADRVARHLSLAERPAVAARRA